MHKREGALFKLCTKSVCVGVSVNTVYHFLPIVSVDCTSSCCSIVILIFASTIVMYFQIRCSVTANSQANNTTELVQYSWKLRDVEQDVFVPRIYNLCILVMYFYKLTTVV